MDRREETKLNTHYSQHIQFTELHARDTGFSYWALLFNAASMGPHLSTSFDGEQPDFSRAARLENSLLC